MSKAYSLLEEEVSISKLSADLQIKQMQLNSMLQISEAVNQNFSRSQLYSIYEFVLHNQLKINHAVLFTHEESWVSTASFGIECEFNEEYFAHNLIYNTPEDMLMLLNSKLACKFEAVIPVFHKKEALAYAFIGPCKDKDVDVHSLVPFLQTITNMVMVAIENKKLYKEAIQQAAVKKELTLAAQMQSMLFPDKLPFLKENVEMAAVNKPYEEVGGDYYDYIRINEHEFITCMADVSGKGIAAALLMANFQATLRALAKNVTSLIQLVEELNRVVIKNAHGEKFITAFICKFNTETRAFEYINAGHNPPLLMEGDEITLLEEGTTGLGMFDKLPFINVGYKAGLKGEEYTMLCYTDGVTELENEKQEAYEMERLQDFLKRNGHTHNVVELQDKLLAELEEFKGHNTYHDDISILICKCRF